DRPTRSIISCARLYRSSLRVPRISNPYATLSITRRCGSNPKCWNTMANRRRRSSRSRAGLAWLMSSPSSSTAPEVGSISRGKHRPRVDLPDPDRAMTTKTPPCAQSNNTSFTAATQPVSAISSARGSDACGVPAILSARGPKIFHSSWTASAACPSLVRAPVSTGSSVAVDIGISRLFGYAVAGSATEPVLGAGAKVLPDVLGLAVLVQSGRAELAADAGPAEAAPLGLRQVGVVVVDPHRPVPQPGRDPLGLSGVLGPDRTGQAVVGVVGDPHRVVLVGEPLDGQHRTERLLVYDPHGLVALVQHGRQVVDAGGQRA